MTTSIDPDTLSSPYSRAPIRTQADLETFWRETLGRFGPVRDGIWLLMIDADDRPVPALTQIDDEDDGPPGPRELEGLALMAGHVLDHAEPGAGRWAFLRCRTGPDGLGEPDRSWARDLMAACRRHGVPTDVPHVLLESGIVPLPLDELTGSP